MTESAIREPLPSFIEFDAELFVITIDMPSASDIGSYTIELEANFKENLD